MKQWRGCLLGVVLACLMATDTHFLSTNNTPALKYQPVYAYSSFFNGVELQRERLLGQWRNLGLTDPEIWEQYQILHRLAAPTIVASHTSLPQAATDALEMRRVLARRLLQVSHKKDIPQWKRDAIFDVRRQREKYNTIDGQVFDVFLGVSEQDLGDLAQPQPFGRPLQGSLEKSIGQLAMINPNVSFVPSKVVGPYSQPSHDSHDRAEVWKDESISWYASTPQQVLQLDQAVAAFEDELFAQGLMAIRLPLGMVETTDDLNRMRGDVKRFGTALSIRSKMGPRALGLKGRVFWVYGVSNRALARAHTIEASENVRVIHSPWDSMAHEWFHGLTGLMAKPNTGTEKQRQQALWGMRELELRIRHDRPNSTQWRDIMNQARTRSQRFLYHYWSVNIFEQSSFPSHIPTEKDAVRLSLAQTSSSYDAAVMATHVYWLQHPHKSPRISSWVARRELLDKMLVASGWNSNNPNMVQRGYFSDPEEWMAAALQGDMMMFSNMEDREHSLMNIPLPQEAQDYSGHWNKFFARLQPWWNNIPDNATLDPTMHLSEKHLSEKN